MPTLFIDLLLIFSAYLLSSVNFNPFKSLSLRDHVAYAQFSNCLSGTFSYDCKVSKKARAISSGALTESIQLVGA